MSIGPSIKKVREYREWKQGKVAEKAGISQTHLSKIERGKIDTPHFSTIEAVLSALGVNSDRVIKTILDGIEAEESLEFCKADSQFG